MTEFLHGKKIYIEVDQHFFDNKEEKLALYPSRKASAKILGTSYTNIACGSSCTELLNSIVLSLNPSRMQNIVGTSVSFPSTVYPWTRASMVNGL